MYNFLIKHGQVVAFGLGLLIILVFFGGISAGMEEFSMLPEDQQKTSDIFNFGLYAAIVLTVLCAAIAILFGIYHVVDNPKGSLKGLLGVGALLAIFFVARAMAAPDTGSVAETAAEFNVTPAQSATISAALVTALVMAGIAALSVVLSEIRNFFK